MRLFRRAAGHLISRRAFAFAGVFAVALSLAGCFDNEPEQRKAFIAFLHSRIIDKPGLHIPIVSDQEFAAIGTYVQQYNIMKDFHHRLDEKVSGDLARLMQGGNPRSLEDLRDRRDIIPLLKSGTARIKDELDKAETDANTARLALKQPADLKVVYDTAFERMVTRPARAFREIVPIIETGLPSIEALANYLDAHRDTISFRGGSPVVSDPKIRAELGRLIDAAAKAGEASEQGKRKLRAMAEGK